MDVPPATSWQYIALDTQKLPDIRVRRALNYAVDKQQIVQNVLFGVGRVADSPIGSGYRMHASVGAYDYNPDRARQLLAEAGWKAGAAPLTFLVPSTGYAGWPELAQAVQAYLKAVGVETKLLGQEWATYSRPRARRPPSAASTWRCSPGARRIPTAGCGSSSLGSGPAGRQQRCLYRNPRVDELLARGAATIGFEKRAPLYR